MILILFISFCQGIYFTLSDKREYCIGVTVKNAKELWGQYIISGEGDKNVVITMKDSSDKLEFASKRNSREGKIHVKSPKEGTHSLCFKSKDSKPKAISFDVHSDETSDGKVATDDEIEPFQKSLKKVGRTVDIVYRNLRFYKLREKVHRDLSEKTCDRVIWATGFKVFSLVLVSLLQIWGLTKMISSSSSHKV
jgi:emp24/gp25L/p24 family/GOLD